MNKNIKNLPASIHQKLRNIAKNNDEDVEAVLYRYVAERFLYRLSISKYKNQFFLKGAFLFTIWKDEPHRTTRDIDFLGSITNQIEELKKIFTHISSIPCEEDGLFFDSDSIKGELIMEGKSYGGTCFKQYVRLGKIKIVLKIDVGFGDVITPHAEEKEFPSLLGMAKPKIKAYPIYTVIAEKLEAMVALDMNNTRLKDFYDLWFLMKNFEIDTDQLIQAIKNTFSRRGTSIPIETPIALTEKFSLDEGKRTQWRAFLRKNDFKEEQFELKEVISSLNQFFSPILDNLLKPKST